jgi:hypothetical protein
MSEALADVLNEIKADSDTIQNGLRLYIGEKSDDLPPHRMQEVIRTQSGHQELLDAGLKELQNDAAHLEEAALAFLDSEWREPENRPRIRSALTNAKKHLALVETAMLALVTMYGMYLLATRGISTETRTRRREDGIWEKVEIKYADPSKWIDGILGLFRRPK